MKCCNRLRGLLPRVAIIDSKWNLSLSIKKISAESLVLRGPQSCATTSNEVDIFRHSFLPDIFTINFFLKILSNVSNNSTLPAYTQEVKPRHFIFCLKQRIKILWKFSVADARRSSVFDVDFTIIRNNTDVFSIFQEM